MFKLFKLIALAGIFALSACTKDKSNNPAIKHFRYASQTNLSTLDPGVCYDQACNEILGQMYETLLEYHYKKRPYKLKPLLAESLPKISNNGTRYTFKLRDDVYYQDHVMWKGAKRKLMAQDFINQIKRVAFTGTESRGWWIFDKKIKGLNDFRDKVKTYQEMISTNVEGLSAPDNRTFIIDLIEPNAQFLYSFAMNFTAPIPLEAINYYKNNLNQEVVTTGPFILKKWIPSSKVEMIKNPNFRVSFLPGTKERMPQIDKITIPIIKEAPTRWLNFSKGNLDLLELDKDDNQLAINSKGKLKKELSEKGIVRHLTDSMTYWWISFNMTHSILGKNVNLRKAIAHSINRDKFIELFTSNLGKKGTSIFPPGIYGFQDKKPWPIEYNLKKAKDYLAKAGFPQGKGLPQLTFDLRNASSKRRQMGEFYQSQLNQIGINLRVIPNTFPGFLKKAREGKLELWQDGWIMDYPDPENVLQLLHSANKSPGPNATSFHNDEFDKLFAQYMKTGNSDLLPNIEGIVKKELPWHMMYYSRYNILVHSRVKNYYYSDVINNFFKYLKISP